MKREYNDFSGRILAQWDNQQCIGRTEYNYGNTGPRSRRLVAQTLQIGVRPAASAVLLFPAFHLSHRFLGNVVI